MNFIVNESVQENCVCACGVSRWESEGITVFVVNCGTGWRNVVGFMPQEVGWAPEMFLLLL
jgi:hypothetical protein